MLDKLFNVKQVNIRQLGKMNARQLAREPFEVVTRKKVVGRFVPARSRPEARCPNFASDKLQGKTPEVFSHDADGNLKQDAEWKMTWDGENRLVSLETSFSATAAGKPRQKLEFAYDGKSRRIQKKVYEWDTDHWSLTADQRFAYDGWNLISILNSALSPQTSFLWGTDLSGSMQGAGGVGGLLAVSNHQSPTGTHFPAYDGNGNLTALVSSADGTESARYEYGPFGELLRASGSMAPVNPRNQARQTPLHYAAWNGRLRTVKALLKAGASPKAADHIGNGCLSYNRGVEPSTFASEAPDSKAVAEALIAAGAPVNMAAKIPKGYTPLMSACANAPIDVVELLLKNGANLSAKTPHGATAYSIAETKKREDVLKLLNRVKAEKVRR